MAELKDELFLDLLTKEEREALLNKKMEEIRKKNDALRRRHQEIEADKKYAAKLKVSAEEHSNVKDNYRPQKTPSPRKDIMPSTGEDKKARVSKSGGRGRGKVKKEDPVDHRGDFRVIQWEFKNSAIQDKDNEDFPQRTPPRTFHKSPNTSGQRKRPHQKKTNNENRFSFPQLRQDMPRVDDEGDDDDEVWEPSRRGDVDHRQMSCQGDADHRNRWKSHDTRHDQFSNSSPAPHGRGRLQELSQDGSGPPPDPTYNFLLDRRRESSNQEPRESTRKESRRHPKNFGGQDFGNVPAQMRERKERQERPKSGPPRTKMEMSLAMTGRERLEYTHWKEERERIDSERLARQKSQTGEWRRAWDAEKNQQDFDEASSNQRTEPAKRPAGRIGSGRFDRGERDERHRVETPGRQKGVKIEDQLPPKPGRGRARGRGRGRGRGSPRPRTFSGGDETRKVECQKDLLVVKIDNSGKEHDTSVEVEYWDDDLLEVKSVGRTPPGGSQAPASRTPKLPETNSHVKSSHAPTTTPVVKDQFIDSVDDLSRKRTDSQSLSLSAGDDHDHDESWEDCPDSSEFYGTTDDESKSQSSHKDFKSNKVKDHQLKLNTRLNPDAAEFQPSPPDVGVGEFLPTSPDFMKTPPGHVKVMDWVSEVTDNLSPTSPPPMEGYAIKKELLQKNCQATLFKEKIHQDDVTKQSSSVEGVTKMESHTSSNGQEQTEGVCEEEGDELFEIAPEHGEGTSDAPSTRIADAVEAPSGTDPELNKDSRILTEENTGEKSMEDNQNTENPQCDSEGTKDVSVEETDTSDVPDAKCNNLQEQVEQPVQSTQLVQDATQDSVAIKEKDVNELSANSVQKDNTLSDVDECSDQPEQGKVEDSVDVENKDDDDESSKQAVPSPNTSKEDTSVASSDKKEGEAESKQDTVVKEDSTSEKSDTNDDQVSESTVPKNIADESAMEQKSSDEAEGPHREPSTTDDHRPAAESPPSS
ncbi:coiled-coil domain-containing protein 9-like isoform X2 [Gigantopelta aegis]|uniref:coiled-coil domain-containing protein 9-like isoform X2 n=1 Tax=Gigantopelta aegis TaxID=1735272 RepID=UPI001B8898DC|nr:coiled-coil domain-containing protein 9-like isoform X2 [Gigantopelta aegis]